MSSGNGRGKGTGISQQEQERINKEAELINKKLTTKERMQMIMR